MSRGHTNRTGTQTPSSIHLPLRLSTNIPAFATTAVQLSKTVMGEEEALITDLTTRGRSPPRRPGSPLPGTEACDRIDGLLPHNSLPAYLGYPYGNYHTQNQMTGDYVTAPFYRSPNSERIRDRDLKNFPRSSVFGELQSIPNDTNAAADYCYDFAPSSTIERSIAYQQKQMANGFRRAPFSGQQFYNTPPFNNVDRVDDVNRYPRAPTVCNTAQISTDFKYPLAGTKTKLNRMPYGYSPSSFHTAPGNGDIFGSSAEFKRMPPSGVQDRNRIPTGSAGADIDQISSGFGGLHLSQPRQNFNSIPYEIDTRRKALQGASMYSDLVDYRPVLSNNRDNYRGTTFDYIESDTYMDNDAAPTTVDFDGISNNYPTIRRRYPFRNPTEVGTDSNYTLPPNSTDRGRSALELPQQTTARFSRRRRRPLSTQPQLPAVPEETSHGTQSPKIPYMTRLSKFYRKDGTAISIRPSPISNQQLNVRATQSPSSFFPQEPLEIDNQLENEVLGNVQGTYSRQSNLGGKFYIDRAFAVSDAEKVFYPRRQFSPPELEGEYVTRQSSPTALNRTYSIPTGRPLSSLAPMMNRTMSSPHTVNRPHLTPPAPRRSRSPGAVERKHEDVPESKKIDVCNPVEGSSIPIPPRRASTLDISSYLTNDEPGEVPLYKSFSDSSIDITDDGGYSPTPTKKISGANLRRFRPLPKLHEEAIVDTEYGPMKESDYFRQKGIVNTRAPDPALSKVLPMRRPSSPLRSPLTWDEFWEPETSEFAMLDEENDLDEEWKDVQLDDKDEEEQYQNFADSMIEGDTQNKEVKPLFTAQTDLANNTSSTKTFDQSFLGENMQHTLDASSQFVYNAKTKGVQVKGSKLMPLPVKTKKRKAAEEMYQSITEDIMY